MTSHISREPALDSRKMPDQMPDTLCDTCRKFTVSAVKASLRRGLPHYESLEQFLDGSSKVECHICSLIWKALHVYLLDKTFALRLTQKPPLSTRVFATEHNVMGFACGMWNSDRDDWDNFDIGKFSSRGSIAIIKQGSSFSW
jgi:hypothetical protein